MTRVKRWTRGWPMIVWLVLIWCILWQNYSLGNIVFGLVLALVVTKIFYLPPIELTGRFNIFYAVLFFFEFLWLVLKASLHVMWTAFTQGPRTPSAVIAVTLRSQDDLIVVITGEVASLIPGSVVLEVDRSSSTLYMHCLNVATEAQAERVRQDVLSLEAQIIKIMGSKSDLALLRSGYIPDTQTAAAYQISAKPMGQAAQSGAVQPGVAHGGSVNGGSAQSGQGVTAPTAPGTQPTSVSAGGAPSSGGEATHTQGKNSEGGFPGVRDEEER